LAANYAERNRRGEAIYHLIEKDMRIRVFSTIRAPAAEDVLQEIWKAIFTGINSSTGEFRAWCRGIARHKIHDHYRRHDADRLQPMTPEEVCQLAVESGDNSALSAADWIDLKNAITLLKDLKPECWDFLWDYYIVGLDYDEIAKKRNLTYDAARMKIERCLKRFKSLLKKANLLDSLQCQTTTQKPKQS
jgi:RNA polymerase sigma factor (sigma-70 family)